MPAPGEDIGPTSLWASEEMKVWLSEDMRGRIGKAYPLRRVGTPADIAPAVLFLASDVGIIRHRPDAERQRWLYDGVNEMREEAMNATDERQGPRPVRPLPAAAHRLAA